MLTFGRYRVLALVRRWSRLLCSGVQALWRWLVALVVPSRQVPLIPARPALCRLRRPAFAHLSCSQTLYPCRC